MTTVHVSLESQNELHDGLILSPEVNMTTGSREFQSVYGAPTSLEADLLRLGAAVYCTDLAVKRGERERFMRDIELHIPVTNYHLFLRLRDQVEQILTFLSSDNWTVVFHRVGGPLEDRYDWPAVEGEVLLFSGGLDSLAAAYECLSAGVQNLHLVSHITSNTTVRTTQEQLFRELARTYAGQVNREAFFVSGRTQPGLPFPRDEQREDTQRTRSFMFLILAALVARRRGISRVLLMAENGQMAIHLPLTSARIGAFSTRTAHPRFLRDMEHFLSDALEFQIRVVNPFLYMTKAQVISRLVTEAPELIPLSGSCWRTSRVGGGYRHCGNCIPCLLRRIALEYHGLRLAEYERDLFIEDISSLPPDDVGKRNLVDLAEFVIRFHRHDLQTAVWEFFPELFDDTFDANDAVRMYTRFAQEAVTVLSRYPAVGGLLA